MILLNIKSNRRSKLNETFFNLFELRFQDRVEIRIHKNANTSTSTKAQYTTELGIGFTAIEEEDEALQQDIEKFLKEECQLESAEFTFEDDPELETRSTLRY